MPSGSVFHTSVVICYVRARSENNIKVQQAKMLMLYNSYFKRQILPWRIYDLTSDKTQGDAITIKRMAEGRTVTDNNFRVCYFQRAIFAFNHIKDVKNRLFHGIDSRCSANHVPLSDGWLWKQQVFGQIDMLS